MAQRKILKNSRTPSKDEMAEDQYYNYRADS